jgi:hypothetical protein
MYNETFGSMVMLSGGVFSWVSGKVGESVAFSDMNERHLQMFQRNEANRPAERIRLTTSQVKDRFAHTNIQKLEGCKCSM